MEMFCKTFAHSGKSSLIIDRVHTVSRSESEGLWCEEYNRDGTLGDSQAVVLLLDIVVLPKAMSRCRAIENANLGMECN